MADNTSTPRPSTAIALPTGDRSLNRTIVTLAVPAVVENLLQTVVFFGDTLMVGWLKDPAALAAVGLGSTLFYLLNTLFGALAVSTTALVARRWGGGHRARAVGVAGQSLLLSILISLIVTTVLWPLTPGYLRLMGAEPEVVRQGSRYVWIILASALFSYPMIVANGIMRGAGDTRTPMWNTLAMNAWNIVVSFVLVFGLAGLPALGLEGAAWGTSTARVVGGVLALGALLSRRTPLHLDWRSVPAWNRQRVQRILTLAVPTALEGGLAQSGYLLFMRMVASLGTTTLAAHQIALRVESLSYMPAWGLSVAATTLVGQALGAADPKLAEDSVRRTLLFSIVFNGLLGLVFVLFAPRIISVFGTTPAVSAQAALALAIAAAELPGLGIEMILAGGLRGAGDTRTPMIVTLIGVLFFRLSLVYLLAIGLGWGLAGVWWGTAIDWTMRAALLWIFFVRGQWKEIKLGDDDDAV